MATEQTKRGYERDFACFSAFVAEKARGMTLNPIWASESVLAAFVAWLQAKGRYGRASIRRRVYGVVMSVRAQRPGAWPTSALPAEVREALSRKGMSRRAITEDENSSVAVTENT